MLGEIDLGARVPGEQVIPEDLVDLGEAKQPLHRDRPFASLVGAQNRRLEFGRREGLDVAERQTFLLPDRAQPLAYLRARRALSAHPGDRPVQFVYTAAHAALHTIAVGLVSQENALERRRVT